LAASRLKRAASTWLARVPKSNSAYDSVTLGV
jgi:hypothetical protein